MESVVDYLLYNNFNVLDQEKRIQILNAIIQECEVRTMREETGKDHTSLLVVTLIFHNIHNISVRHCSCLYLLIAIDCDNEQDLITIIIVIIISDNLHHWCRKPPQFRIILLLST